MYSNLKSVQLLISVLKAYNINKIVLSPGGSDIPIIHSIEMDDYFTCYSVVDERSAVYFGIGLSQANGNQAIACVCTSGTAVSNYLPGITEAFYQNVPIVAITADKNPLFQGQIETQKIEQKNIFGEVCKKCVDLPVINTNEEEWYCERLIKEAIIESLHHGAGPVQINIPIVGSYAIYDVEKLPTVRKVEIVSCESENSEWIKYADILSKSKRILIIVGQNVIFSKKDILNIESFFKRFNCLISVEHISNLKCNGCLFTYPLTETGGVSDEKFIPDLVISIGNNVSSYAMKPFLRNNYKKFKHISVDDGGRYRDAFKGLFSIFECTPSYFFDYFGNISDLKCLNDKKYYDLWKDSLNNLKIGDFKFSNFYVARQLAKIIPENSLLHLAILNSTRIMQFFELAKGVRTYSNVGALGIDGCLSTFVGQSVSTEELAFCVIGDLSFFYDMNALGIRHLKNNVRIILLNNGGGGEFYLFNDKRIIPTLDEFICAEHSKKAQGWVESLGIEYFSVTNEAELEDVFSTFSNPSEKPKFVEVFTNKELDDIITKQLYASSKPKVTISTIVKKIINKIQENV